MEAKLPPPVTPHVRVVGALGAQIAQGGEARLERGTSVVHRPRDPERHERWFACPVSWGAPMLEVAFDAAVLALPPRQREVLTLRVDAGLPFKDIADTLGITENNAKVQFHHAVKRLKVELSGTQEEEGS